MIRAFRCFLWFVAGFMLSAWAVVSHASFPATVQYADGGGWKACYKWDSWPNSLCTGYSYTKSGAEAYADGQAAAAGATSSPSGWSCAGTSCVGSWRSSSGLLYDVSAQREACPAGSSADANGNCYSYVCPSNSTLSGSSCTCNSGNTEVNGACVSNTTCTSSGSAGASGYWDVGTSSTSNPPVAVCSGGCMASFVGTCPSKTAIVGGATHFFCSGGYQLNGAGPTDTCTAGSGGLSAPGTPSTSVPSDSCGSGQYKGQINGKTVCVDSATNKQVPTGPTFIAGTSCSTATNADSTITQTCITQDAQGNQTTNKTTYPANTPATSMAPVSSSTTTQTSSTSTSVSVAGSLGGGGTSINPQTGQPSGSMSDFCMTNPTAMACSSPSSGTGVGTTGVYTKDGSGKTFAGSLQNFNATLQGGGFYSAAVNFFSVGNLPVGSCSGLAASLTIFGKPFNVDLGQYLCGSSMDSIYSLAGYGVILGALVAAFWIAIIL